MKDYSQIEQYYDILKSAYDEGYAQGMEDGKKALEEQPKTGHWIEHGLKEGLLIEKYTCSECDYYSGTKTTNYCPECGAKMQ